MIALLRICPVVIPSSDWHSSFGGSNPSARKKDSLLRANPCKNRPKSPIRGKAQKIKIALLLHRGRPK